jgi:thioredoxin reductase
MWRQEMLNVNVLIIGGGIAGLSAAIGAYDEGIRDILICDREQELGGILQQCIHPGFGIQSFKQELSGPTYAHRWMDEIEARNIQVLLGTSVLKIDVNKKVEAVNPKMGYFDIQANAIVLAMGSRERPRGAIIVPGTRCSGIWTAGTAQRYLNLEGRSIGKRVFIIGSGDIGLIMARRLSLEGATVVGVAEIMPYSNGLARNIKQCLDDFNIPLFLSHTVSEIKGKDRVNSIILSKVDEQLDIIENTEKSFEVDTVLFSIGLIPENTLSEEMGLQMDLKTKGPLVNHAFETSIPGVFAAGNVLHIHDIVDFVAHEGGLAGLAVSNYLNSKKMIKRTIPTQAGDHLLYLIPQRIEISDDLGVVELMFRVKKPLKQCEVQIILDDQIIKRVPKKHLNPSEMEKIQISMKGRTLSSQISVRIEVKL